MTPRLERDKEGRSSRSGEHVGERVNDEEHARQKELIQTVRRIQEKQGTATTSISGGWQAGGLYKEK